MTNPIPHKHRPVMTPAGQMCTVCQSILIQPILDFDDARIECVKPKWLVILENTVEYLNGEQSVKIEAGEEPSPIDHILISLADGLGVQWPDYINMLADEYRGMPPHDVKRSQFRDLIENN